MDADETTEHRPLDGHEDRLVETEAGPLHATGATVGGTRALVREPGRDHCFLRLSGGRYHDDLRGRCGCLL